MAENTKKRRGDRKDGAWIREIDGMHLVLSSVMGNRCDNEAVMNLDIDATPLDAYLKTKNVEGNEYKYTYLQVFIAAMAKTIEQRPKMNIFISNGRFYQKNEISFVFVAKRYFGDDADEALIFIKYDPNDPRPVIEQIHDKYASKVYPLKKDKAAKVVKDPLDFMTKFTPFGLKCFARFAMFMDRHGWLPNSIQKIDPMHTTCFISNLGSIKMNANYHHLANWGTNSLFVLIGKKENKPVFAEDGSYELRPMLPLGITVDERIADGLYFYKSIEIMKDYLEHPEKLDIQGEN